MDDLSCEVPLREVLSALGWSSEQLIARTNQVRGRRGAHPLHPKSGYPWMRGRRPARDVIDDVLAAINEHSPDPVTASHLAWGGDRDRRPSALASPYDASATDLLRETQGVPMHRRTFVLLSGAAVTGVALDLMIGSAGQLRAVLDGDLVTPVLVDDIEVAIRRSHALDNSEGSTSALQWAGGLWQTLGEIVTDGRYREPEAVRLHRAYVELSESYGWMLYDAGKYPQAQRVYATGMRLARSAQPDPTVDRATVNLLSSAAASAMGTGQLSEARTLLAVARERAPRTLTPRTLAVIAHREVSLAGRDGDHELLRRARDAAHLSLDSVADVDEPWWSTWLSHRQVDLGVGKAWLYSNRPESAEPHLRPVLDPTNPMALRRDRAVYIIELLNAQARTGDINSACETAGQARALLDNIRSPRLSDRLDATVTHLRRHHANHPAVRALVSA